MTIINKTRPSYTQSLFEIPTNLTNAKHQIAAAILLASTIAVTKLGLSYYNQLQNGNLDHIDCSLGQTVDGVLRNFQFYKNAAEKSGLAADQYCLAESFKAGIGTELSLANARVWYKKAADQGLALAQKALCQPSMFDIKFAFGTLYSEYRNLCCKEVLMNDSAYSCPWDKPLSYTIS